LSSPLLKDVSKQCLYRGNADEWRRRAVGPLQYERLVTARAWSSALFRAVSPARLLSTSHLEEWGLLRQLVYIASQLEDVLSTRFGTFLFDRTILSFAVRSKGGLRTVVDEDGAKACLTQLQMLRISILLGLSDSPFHFAEFSRPLRPLARTLERKRIALRLFRFRRLRTLYAMVGGSSAMCWALKLKPDAGDVLSGKSAKKKGVQS